jgi:hypothetical protein
VNVVSRFLVFFHEPVTWRKNVYEVLSSHKTEQQAIAAARKIWLKAGFLPHVMQVKVTMTSDVAKGSILTQDMLDRIWFRSYNVPN